MEQTITVGGNGAVRVLPDWNRFGGILLDTNVISAARKPGGNANVKAWLASVRGEDLYLITSSARG